MGSSQQSTSSQQQTQPWSPAVPLLNQQLGSISGLNTQPTTAQNTAVGNLQTAANGLPNFSQPATSATNAFLGGDPTGLLNPALSAYNSAVSPIATASLNPLNTPGIGNALATNNHDITNSINGMFAGAGRDLSGLNTQALARGLAQGDSSLLLNQYNQNVANTQNAAGGLLGAAGTTAGAMAGNTAQGFNMAGLIPGLSTSPATTQLSAAQQAYTLPYQNLASAEGLTLPIAGLGSQSSGQSSTTATPSLYGMLTQPLSGFGSASPIGAGLSMLLSDRRMKKDIEQVGTLFDGTPVYRFRYLTEGAMQIGLMADEVPRESIQTIHGIKQVDYEMATQRAVEMSHGAV